jgi:hypothetical protein
VPIYVTDGDFEHLYWLLAQISKSNTAAVAISILRFLHNDDVGTSAFNLNANEFLRFCWMMPSQKSASEATGPKMRHREVT